MCTLLGCLSATGFGLEKITYTDGLVCRGSLKACVGVLFGTVISKATASMQNSGNGGMGKSLPAVRSLGCKKTQVFP